MSWWTLTAKAVLRKLVPKSARRRIDTVRIRIRDRKPEAELLRVTKINAVGLPRTLSFYPKRPRHTSAIRPIAAQLGMEVRLSRHPAQGVVVFWPDSEEIFPPQPDTWINHRCTNIDKDYVDRTFTAVSGYSITIDPQTYTAPYVRKSIRNATHDGVVLEAPSTPLPGYVYQRLIDNVFGDEIEEIRVIFISGVLDFVYVKRRPLAERFLIPNKRVTITDTALVLSPSEVAIVEETARRIGLDYGEIDVLRDRQDGRIYVIDVNRTPAGPPKAFTPAETAAVVARMAARFRSAYLTN